MVLLTGDREARAKPKPAAVGNDRGGALETRVPAELVRAELDRILRSPWFLHSERLSRFLRFVVEQTLRGHAGDLKESVLAVEVFDRPPTYDSRVHSIVRVEASRLREKLQRYYQTEGLDAEVRIELRKGSYVPLFRERDPTPIRPALVPSPAGKRPQVVPAAAIPVVRPRLLALAGVVLVLITAAVTWRLVTGHRALSRPVLRRLTSDTGLTFQPTLAWRAKLLAYAQRYPEEAVGIHRVLRFRRKVSEEFERLVGQKGKVEEVERQNLTLRG